MNSRTDHTGAAQDPPSAHPRSWLSALADGDAQAADPACAMWRDDPQARQTWHTYHLIGDVMRSEDLAARPSRDAAFLAAVRERLAAEPVVLAPVATVAAAASAPRRQAWLVPAAAAAGFVVVAGVLVAVRGSMPGAADAPAQMAAASSPAPRTQLAADTAPGTQLPVRVERADTIIRDARLDEYLRAHQSARGGVAVAAPGGMLRRADATVPAGAER